LPSSLHHIIGHTIIVMVVTNDWPFISYRACCSALSPSLTHFHCHHRMYSSSNTLAPPQLRSDVLSSEKGDQRQRFVSYKVRSLIAYSSHSCYNKHTMMWMILNVTTLQQLSTFQHWEGTSFPVDPLRPLSNLYHNKLALCVDWAVDPVTKMGNHSPRLP